MMKYYIQEINLNKINSNNIINLKKNFHYSKKININLLSDTGFYKYIDDKLYLFSLNYNHFYKSFDNFLNKFTLLYSHTNEFFKQKYPTNNIPFNHTTQIKQIDTYKLNDYSNTSLIIEYIINDNSPIIHDLYFISNLNHDDFSFIEDISYFINLLI